MVHSFPTRRSSDLIDVVLLDMIMPEMDGSRVFSVLRQIDPDVRVAICSGYAKDHKVEKLIAQGACAFIEKPFDPETLARTIRDILRHSRDVDQRREPSGDPRVDET